MSYTQHQANYFDNEKKAKDIATYSSTIIINFELRVIGMLHICDS